MVIGLAVQDLQCTAMSVVILMKQGNSNTHDSDTCGCSVALAEQAYRSADR